MQCPVCHNEVAPQSAFCGHCGASIAGVPASEAVPTPTAYTVPPATAAPVGTYPAPAAAAGISPNLAAAIAYLTFIPALIFLLVEPYNKTPIVRFHSFQSIGLAVVVLVIDIALRVLLLPFSFLMYSFVQGIFSLGFFVIWIIVVLKAIKGEWFKLPIIGDFAMKQAQS
jgi:uncharacterized membrane protein